MIYTPDNREHIKSLTNNGVNIKHDTFYIDTELQIVKKYKRNEKGHYYLDGDTVAFEEVKGNISIVFSDGTTLDFNNKLIKNKFKKNKR